MMAGVIINARWIVGFDGRNHRLIKNGSLAYSGKVVVHVGERIQKRGWRVIEASEHLVIPGLISTNSTLSNGSGSADVQARLACLLRNGVTTVVGAGVSGDQEGPIAEICAAYPLRVHCGPLLEAPGPSSIRVDRAAQDGLRAAVQFLSRRHGTHVAGMIALDCFLRTSVEMRAAAARAARQHGVPLTVIVGDDVWDFQHVLRNTGRTPVGHLLAEGILGAGTIISPARIIGGQRRTGYVYADDIAAIASGGATIAHVPLEDAADGEALQTIDKLRAAGANVSLAVQDFPFDMILAMRWASIVCKTESGDHLAAPAATVLEAATLAGARALGRTDIGCLAPGALADIVIVNLGMSRIGPVYDPIKALVHAAEADNIETVIIGGEIVVERGTLVRHDESKILRDLGAAGKHTSEVGKTPSFPAWVSDGAENQTNLSAGRTTLVRGGTIVGWQDGQHRILDGGVIAYRGNRILHVGRNWPGAVDETIDATGKLICPGFISLHAHASAHTGDRLVVDAGRKDLLRTGFLNYSPLSVSATRSTPVNQAASVRFGLASLLRNGITTTVQLDSGYGQERVVLQMAKEAGIRMYYGPYCNGGIYLFDREGRLVREQREHEGLSAIDRSGEWIAQFDKSCGGRIRGIFMFDELFQATPALLARLKRAAADLGVGITVHFAEQLYEYHAILKETGLTPVGWAAALGFLGPEVILGHCIYLSHHRFVGGRREDDLDTLAATGASLAHAPVALARRGMRLDSLKKYSDRGIPIGIGTDSYPQDIIAEMRAAKLLCRLEEGESDACSAAEVFNAATIGGSRALRRDDLGRLEAGACADIVIIDMGLLRFGHFTDPIRALIERGNGECVDTVIVDGKTLIKNGHLTVWDEREVTEAAADLSGQVWESWAERDWAGRAVDEAFPPSLQSWNEVEKSTASQAV